MVASKKYLKQCEEYNKHPNKCLKCGADILCKDNDKLSEVKIKKFCNRQCANEYYNTSRIKDRHCIVCGEKLPSKSKAKYCDECRNRYYNTRHIDLVNMTKGELIKRRGYFKARSSICKNARTIFYRETKNNKCAICGYDKYIEVCHIKAVQDFDNSAKVSEINSIKNLVGLCPNHHKEFDNGLINFDTISNNST